ncbi:TonB-dependent receptor [Spongiibacter taiwanensis]|uniref:TonB-dependent receptor n=1 Tax=Spongiibacter taiwanensis TaxID=1748242 RepID=UPI002036156F|nr:TonB-dependent receptor [Spongiibacter taiwanensis]USA44410.1 TonB-dependent receptor [Spongiibacter taiwanensis]
MTLVAAMALVGLPAQAQEPAKKRQSRLIEEVVVTAQKREESAQDVPISIQAYSQGVLDAKGVVNAADLPHITPGLTVTAQSGYTSTYIRGVGSDAFVLGDPSVASYIDGVYYPLAAGSLQNFGSVERIEVLKGPQGTLFGRNAVGGAISVITKKPNLNEIEASAMAAYEMYDSPHDATARRTRGEISIPLIENRLAVSLAAVDDEADHHIDGRVGSPARDGSLQDIPQTIEKGVRAKVRFSPLDWLEASLNYSRIDAKGLGSNYAPNQEPSGLGLALPEQDPRGGQLDPPRDQLNSIDIEVYSADLVMNTNWMDIKLLASDQQVTAIYLFDFDGSALPLATFYLPNLYSDNQSAEIQFVSNDESWGSDWLTWTAGAYYFESLQGYDPAFFQLSVANLDAQLALANSMLGGAIDIPSEITDVLQAVGLQADNDSGAGDIYFSGLLKTESLAFYAQATAAINDWLSVTLGARYTDEERTLDKSTSGIGNAQGDYIVPINDYSPSGEPKLSTTTRSLDPKVALEFRPNWDVLGDAPMIYTSYQTATKAAIINVINILPGRPPQVVDEEKMNAFEVGLKTTFFDGMTTLNAAIFHYTIDSPQQQFISFLAGGAVQFENSGEQQQRGFEFDITTPIFPSLVDNLVLSAGALFLDAEYTDYKNASGFSAETGLFEGGNDYSGNQIVKSPDVTGTVSLLKTIEMRGGPLELGVDYYYTSEYSFAPQGTDNVIQEGYGLLGARVSYLYEPWNLRTTLYGKNLTGEDYNIGLFQTDFGTMGARAPQEYYGVRVNWDY